jgi:hypothetical protein
MYLTAMVKLGAQMSFASAPTLFKGLSHWQVWCDARTPTCGLVASIASVVVTSMLW